MHSLFEHSILERSGLEEPLLAYSLLEQSLSEFAVWIFLISINFCCFFWQLKLYFCTSDAFWTVQKISVTFGNAGYDFEEVHKYIKRSNNMYPKRTKISQGNAKQSKKNWRKHAMEIHQNIHKSSDSYLQTCTKCIWFNMFNLLVFVMGLLEYFPWGFTWWTSCMWVYLKANLCILLL